MNVRVLSRGYLIIWVRSPGSLVFLSAVVAAVVGAGVRGLLAPGSGGRGGGAVGGALAQRRQLGRGLPTTAAGVVTSDGGGRKVISERINTYIVHHVSPSFLPYICVASMHRLSHTCIL